MKVQVQVVAVASALLLASCVCGARDDLLDAMLAASDAGWTCRDVGKGMDECRAQLRVMLERR